MPRVEKFINKAFFRARLVELAEKKGQQTIKVIVPIVYTRNKEEKFFVRLLRIMVPDSMVNKCRGLMDKEVYIACKIIFNSKPRVCAENGKFLLVGIRPTHKPTKDIDWNEEKRKYYESLGL